MVLMNDLNMNVNSKDMLIMNLVHYFVTEKNYNPVMIHGIEDEIWLENLSSPYKIVRIVGHYIHNDEQLFSDNVRFGRVVNQIKKKTFTFKMNTLSIYTDLGDNVNLTNDNNNIFVKKTTDLKRKALLEVFPDILEKTKHEEKGMDLFVKMTTDINEKNTKRAEVGNDIFTPKKPIITNIIMGICALVFILMYIIGNGSEDTDTLLKFGANVDVLTKNGEYYRLFTAMFLHIGVLHLLLNMYSLKIIGSQVESFFGKFKYTLILVISGICGSILSLAFYSNTISAGISGAIFGLLGALLYFGYHYRVYLGNVLSSQIIPIILINLLIGFAFNGIDNAAHIGGLVGGLLSAYALGVPDKSTKADKINGWIILSIYVAFIIYLSFIK